ncbi:hypothetical protein AVEN_93725-1 [Araneus ventricosus]|uniref:Transposase Tc1-like domain-containing protein n=1 Tax=Araneus ventricosus TaxID=182803 RepID=A0A4Y2MZA1_ARAVE|nr:hypothetical protein AVEN_93725-1 [Araneus ventricosus]
MSRRNHLHDEMHWRAVGMLQAGARQSAIARELNVHHSVIHRLWNHYQTDQNASRRRGSGCRIITTTADDLYLLQCARRRRTRTARQLVSKFSAAAGRPISCQTVSRRLHEGGLFARLPVVCLPWFPAHLRARLHWAREHRSWTSEQWGHLLFTDESRFNIQNDSRRAMARAWNTLAGTKHRRKRPLQRWRVTSLGRDSNERPNRPLHVRWRFRSQLSDIATKSYTFFEAFYRCNGYRCDIYGR